MGRRQQWRLLAPRRRETLGQWDSVKDLMLDIDAVRTLFLHIAVPAPDITGSKRAASGIDGQRGENRLETAHSHPIPSFTSVARGPNLIPSLTEATTCDKKDSSMLPNLLSLPIEVLLIIFSYLDLHTLYNLTLSTRRLHSIAFPNFKKRLARSLAPWANNPLIFLGSRMTDSGLPPGVLGEEDVDSLHLHSGFTLYLASSRWEDVSWRFWLSPRKQTVLTPGNQGSEFVNQTSLQYRGSAKLLDLEFLFPVAKGEWILRNLTTREYVRASYLDQVAISTFGQEPGAFWGYSVGLFLLLRIVWSERMGEARSYLERQTAWSGHCVDCRMLSEAEVEGWVDISWVACNELCELWKELHFDRSASYKEPEPPSTRRSRAHWRMHGYGV